MINFFLIMSLILLIMTSFSFAHEIILKDGNVIKSKSVWVDNGYVKYDKFGYMISVPEENVESIVYAGKELIADEAMVVLKNGNSLMVEDLSLENDTYTCSHNNAPLIFPKRNVKSVTVKRIATPPQAAGNNTPNDSNKVIFSSPPISEKGLNNSAASIGPNYDQKNISTDNSIPKKIKPEVQLPQENRLRERNVEPNSNLSTKITTTKIYDEKGKPTNDRSYLDSKGRPLFNQDGNRITYPDQEKKMRPASEFYIAPSTSPYPTYRSSEPNTNRHIYKGGP
jgi:hypothetical protein